MAEQLELEIGPEALGKMQAQLLVSTSAAGELDGDDVLNLIRSFSELKRDQMRQFEGGLSMKQFITTQGEELNEAKRRLTELESQLAAATARAEKAEQMNGVHERYIREAQRVIQPRDTSYISEATRLLKQCRRPELAEAVYSEMSSHGSALGYWSLAQANLAAARQELAEQAGKLEQGWNLLHYGVAALMSDDADGVVKCWNTAATVLYLPTHQDIRPDFAPPLPAAPTLVGDEIPAPTGWIAVDESNDSTYPEEYGQYDFATKHEIVRGGYFGSSRFGYGSFYRSEDDDKPPFRGIEGVTHWRKVESEPNPNAAASLVVEKGPTDV